MPKLVQEKRSIDHLDFFFIVFILSTTTSTIDDSERCFGTVAVIVASLLSFIAARRTLDDIEFPVFLGS